MKGFARVTELNGIVQWVNLDHVRRIVVGKPAGEHAVVTKVHIDNSFVERLLTVTETPEQILASVEPGG